MFSSFAGIADGIYRHFGTCDSATTTLRASAVILYSFRDIFAAFHSLASLPALGLGGLNFDGHAFRQATLRLELAATVANDDDMLLGVIYHTDHLSGGSERWHIKRLLIALLASLSREGDSLSYMGQQSTAYAGDEHRVNYRHRRPILEIFVITAKPQRAAHAAIS